MKRSILSIGAVSIIAALGTSFLHASAVSQAPDTNTWGVEGIVYAVHRVGDTVYLGGDFTNLVAPNGVTKLSAAGLAALDVNTGQPTSWRPMTDTNTVFAIDASPDGSTIYVGGSFARINGKVRNRFAAISSSGALLWTNHCNSTVRSIVVSGNTIYLGGSFTTVQTIPRSFLAAIQPPPPGGTGAALLPWAPSVSGGSPTVYSIAVANGDLVAIGQFTRANSVNHANQARFDALTGAVKTWTYHVAQLGRAIVTDGVNYYAAFGGSGGTVASFGPTGNLRWSKYGDGDAQAVTLCAGQVIAGGHWGVLDNVGIQCLVAMNPANGAIDPNWNPHPNLGLDRGVWALHGVGNMLHVGGAFLKVGTEHHKGYAQYAVVDTQPPTTPTNVSALATDATRVNLSWRASTDNVEVSRYDLFRNGSPLVTLGTVTNYADITVLPLTTYNYQVRAADGLGNLSALSSAAIVTTPSETIPPSTPANLAATAISEGRVDLAWSSSTDNIGVTGYDVLRNGTMIVTVGIMTNYSDTSALPASTYSYQVRARDAAGNLSPPSNTATATTPTEAVPPTVPTDLTATATDSTRVDLAWGASTDNYAVAAYLIYRNGAFLATTGMVTNHADTTAAQLTTYTYQVHARDTAGNLSAPSNPATITTPPDASPTTPASLIATAISPVQINLRWLLSTDNVGVTGYSIYRGGSLLATIGVVTNYSDVTCVPSTTYSYNVRARDAAGNFSDPSNPAIATSLADTQAPTTPSSLAATALSSRAVGLTWRASTDNVAISSYVIYRNFASLVTVTAVTNHVDTNVSPSNFYRYWVRARDAAGNFSGYSNEANTTTPSADTTPPSAPTNLVATALSATQVNLRWRFSTDNRAVTGYDVYRNSALLANIGTVTNYSDTTTAPLTAYSYQVRARDADGNLSTPSNLATLNTPADTQAPTLPTGLTAIAASPTHVELRWASATDNVSVAAYDLYRNGTLVGSTGAVTNYSDSTVSPATGYSYQVRARDAAGNVSAPSNTASVTTPPDTQPPTAPANLTAITNGSTEVDLHWDAATDNVAVTGYDVFRDGALVAGNLLGTTYADTNTSALVTYIYHVRARDGAGNRSPLSNEVTLTVPDTVPPTVPANVQATAASVSQVDLDWHASTDNVGVAGYEIYRDGLLLASNVVSASYPDTTVTVLGTHNYQVRASDASGNSSSPSDPVTITVPDLEPPGTPTDLIVTGATSIQVDLSWSAVTDNVGVTGYHIYRSAVLIATNVAGTIYSDTTPAALTTYHYAVRARDEAGNLSAALFVTMTTPDTLAPSTPIDLAAVPASATRIDLTWTASIDNIGVAGYDLYRNGDLIEENVSATDHSDVTAAPATSYTYQVRGRDAAGNLSDWSHPASATTPADLAAPSTPSNLTATASAAQVDLNWMAATDNVAVTGYDIYREGELLAGNHTTTTFSDTTISLATTYQYQVRARDGAGNESDWSNLATVTTPDLQPPTAPTNVTAVASSWTLVELAWTASSDNVGVTGYNIHRNGSLLVANHASTSYPDSSAKPGQSYAYELRARDAAGNVSDPSDPATANTPADTEPPSMPANVSATANGPKQVDLAWTASTDNVAVSNYDIYRNGILLISHHALTNYADNTVSPATSYHYQVRARDSSGNLSDPSPAATALTAADTQPPSPPTSPTATVIGANRVDLYWNASTDNVGVSHYEVFRNDAMVAQIGSVLDYSDATVGPSTTYQYKIRSLDAAGNRSLFSSRRTVTTPADTQPPITPSNLTAVAASVTNVVLSWTISTDDVGVAGYQVHRDGVLLATVGLATHYSDITVASLTSYRYEIRAIDGAGNVSGPSNEAAITTPDSEPPTSPTNLTAVAISATQVDLAWDESMDNIAVTGYEVYREGALLASIGIETNYADNTAAPSTTYQYQVRGHDAAGNRSGPSETVIVTTLMDTDAPSPPTNLTAFATSPIRVELSWDAATDNAGVTGYEIFRDGLPLASHHDATHYSDSTVAPATLYDYQVRARDAVGHLSELSDPAMATTPADTDSPSVPTGVTAVAQAANLVNLTWTPSTDDVGVTGYYIYRDGLLLGENHGTNIFSDTTAVLATTYSYQVRARDAANHLSDLSAPATVTTPDTEAPTAPGNLTGIAMSWTQVQLAWSASSDNVAVSGYDIHRNGIPLVSNNPATSYSDNTASPGQSYTYQARARDTAGNLSFSSSTATATTPHDNAAPTAPGSLTATAASLARIDLSWGASSDNAGVTGYDILRGGVLLASIEAVTGYSDTTVAPKTTYSYKVRARDAAGNLSRPSNSAKATTSADTTPPTLPSGLTGTAISATQVNLGWQVSTDNIGVTGYDVDRNTGLLAQVGPVTSFLDHTAAPAMMNTYKIRARDAAGNTSPWTSRVRVTTPADTTPPTAPTNPTAIATSMTQIDLAWTAAIDNVAVTAYDVHRDGAWLATIGVETIYSDTPVSPLTTYEYEVFARDGVGNVSGPSNPAEVTTSGDTEAPAPPTDLQGTALTETQVELAWTASSDNGGVAGYNVSRDGTLVATVGLVTNYLDPASAPDTTYTYEVRARDEAGNLSDPSAPAIVTTLPDATSPTPPADLAGIVTGSSQVDLTWAAATDNVAVTGYRVHRDGALLATVGNVTSFSDISVSADVTYSYEVHAVDAAGNVSDPSNPVMASVP